MATSRTGPRRRRRGSGTATGRGRWAGYVGRPCSAMARRAAWRRDEQPAAPCRLAPPVPARGGSRGANRLGLVRGGVGGGGGGGAVCVGGGLRRWFPGGV